MRNISVVLLLAVAFITSAALSPTQGFAAQTEKEWTLLVYLNGNNNLDSFGDLNINQMEKVGSTDKINIIVQWASLSAGKTKRLLITKDNDFNKVTSKVIQDMGKVDMGDWRSIVEFVKWAHANYPAKKYFLDVWDHGGGWHRKLLRARGVDIQPSDISWDDNTGHFITTKELGTALRESAKAVGHKIDLYGSDACLMAMAEVANEMADSVSVSVGSEEVEPGAGWPYAEFMQRWAALNESTPAQVATILTEEYTKSYDGGSNGNSDVTFSAFDVTKMSLLNSEIAKLSAKFMSLDKPSRKKVVDAAENSQTFYYGDYIDLSDFADHVRDTKIEGLDMSGLKNAIGEFVIANVSTDGYKKAKGVSLWIPTSMSTFNQYDDKYLTLDFNSKTKWADALKYLLQ